MATTFLPNVVFRPPQVGGSGQMPASDINDLANNPREMTTTVAARGALVPLLYGERDVPGLVFAVGKVGTDLLIGFMWALGECQSIENVYINDALVTNAGGGDTFSLTHYLGTPTQVVDPLLAANIAGYNDRLRIAVPGGSYIGVCYTVARIPVGKISGFPRARAHIKGRKVYDPRTLTTAYSDNPALCVADLVENPVFGLGRTTSGVAACANWCDELLGGIGGAYRARVGLYIATGRPAEEYVDLLCEYAECLRVYEGETVKLIPDKPVDLTSAPVIGPSKIMEGSLSLQAESSTDTPTQVEFQYTVKPADLTQPWSMEPVTVALTGVDSGEVQRIPTSVSMEGVTRLVEASNKAMSRLMRMQNRMTATWTTLDKGVTHQRGDVVKIEHPARGVSMPVRITEVNLVAPGRYQVSARRYDASHYPNDVVLPGEDGIVPVGAIGMLVGTTVPDGWAIYSAANGKYVRGAGADGVTLNASGDSPTGPWAGNVSPGGGHGDAYGDIPAPRAGGSGGSFLAAWAPLPGIGDHTHTFSVATLSENILRRENILVKKVGSTGLKIPPQVRVFGLSNVTTEATKSTAFTGRLLMAAAANANAGVSTQTPTTITTGTADDTHTHYPATSGFDTVGGVGPEAYDNYPSGGVHSHSVAVRPTYNPKRKQLCVYESAGEVSPRPGVIYLWDQDPSLLPADHLLCDGANGTPDMRGRYAEFGSLTADPATGNNTVVLDGVSSSVGHSHQGSRMYAPASGGYGHSSTVTHNHNVNSSHAYAPKWYGLHFVMYSPAG